MHKYRIGVLGLKEGKRWMESVSKRTDTELAVVFDPVKETRQAMATQFNAHAVETEDAFDRTELDAVIVATPDHLHVRQSVRALSLGRHVICEKPMAPTVADCKQIIAAVKKYKKTFMVGQVARFSPAFRLAKEILNSGEIGKLVFIESEYYHDYSGVEGVDGWRKDAKIRREGFIGGGCHALDLIRWLAGDPSEVFCYMNHKYLPTWPTNDTGVAIYKFKNNVIGKVFVSIGVKADYSMRTVLHATNGSVICDNRSDTIQLFSRRYKNTSGGIKLPLRIAHHNTDGELGEFIECLNAKRRSIMDEYEGARTVAFGEAALASARTGKPVKLSPKL